jgi:hypothetical protein
MAENFEDNIDLEPELTWENCATFIYDGVMDGKLNREDFIEFFKISGQEMSDPRHSRIFAKALGAFFKRDYQDLSDDEEPGIFVIVDGKKYIVSHNDIEITIGEAEDIEDIPDNSFLIMHATSADAKISAWKKKERYVDI